MEYIGEEFISTVFGKRRVLHYYYENVTEATKEDLYVDKDTKLPTSRLH